MKQEKTSEEYSQEIAQLEAQVEQLVTLNFIIQMVASGHGLQETLEIVAREMVALFQAYSSSIALLNADRTELKVAAEYCGDPNYPSVVGLVIPITDNLSFSQVIHTGEAVIVSQTQTNPFSEPDQNINNQQTHCLMILPLLARGKIIGVIGITVGQTDREFTLDELALGEMVAVQLAGFIENMRLSDRDLQQAYEQLKEVDKLKSAFISVVTHELRSPFVAAALSIQLLKRYVEHNMFDELQKQIGQVEQELTDGRKLIDNVISFASMVSKKENLYLEAVDFSVVIREAITSLKNMAKTRNIRLLFKIDSQLVPIQVDKERMSEAVYHLVYNAIKFNRDGGSIKILCKQTEQQLVFKVKDTGAGLSQEKLDTIWEAFVQSADDLTRGVEGLGLGLALVKFVVKAHKGQVTATSKPGEGSVFGFSIPMQPVVKYSLPDTF